MQAGIHKGWVLDAGGNDVSPFAGHGLADTYYDGII